VSPTPPPVTQPTAPIVIAGENWSLTFGSSTNGPLTSLEGAFDVAGGTITAYMQPFGSCLHGDTTRLSLSGTRSGSAIQMEGGGVRITATMSADGQSLQGTFLITAGVCGSGTTTGSVVGRHVDLTGVWSGTMGQIPAVVDLTMATKADAEGNFTLSGPVKFSNTQCFATATITRRGRGRVLFPDIVGDTQRLELIALVSEDLASMNIDYTLVSGVCPELSFGSGRLVRQ